MKDKEARIALEFLKMDNKLLDNTRRSDRADISALRDDLNLLLKKLGFVKVCEVVTVPGEGEVRKVYYDTK